MAPNFGDVDPALTAAVNRIARGDSRGVRFSRHAQEEMAKDGFDHQDVMECLAKGKAHAPEQRDKGLCSNVVHRGLHIRVVVGGLDEAAPDWDELVLLRVVTVMEY